MSRPRFSVVIPTRERADTLRSALATCLAQDFDSFEVVVCDNHSSPATREVVEAADSPRVRYIRAPRPLAMSANWELAVSHASGEYVLVVGDDDGLLPFALSRADRLLRETGLAVLRWEWAFYNWPSHLFPNQRNGLEVPLGWGFRTAAAAEVIRAVVNEGAWHPALPMLYNSAVRRDILDALRRRAGRVFASVCPDIYSGIAVAAVAGEFGVVGTPLSVCGSSGGTVGGHVVSDPDSTVAREFWRLNADDGLVWHPLAPRLAVLPAFAAECFLQARDRLFPDDPNLALDRPAVAMHCLRANRARDEAEWRDGIDRIAASLADDPAARDDFLRRAADVPMNPFHTPDQFAGDRPWTGVRSGRLCLNAADYGVTNVADAVALCAELVGGRPEEAEWLELRRRLAGAEHEAAELGRSAGEARRTLDESWSCLPHRLVRAARAALGSGRRAG
jgi:glycosyltransferase involved in cell wall biosynthesis